MLPVALVSTGHEVLRGHTVNTNAAWLGRAATAAGARVVSVRTVGDDVPDIERAIRGALDEASFVVVTGGLGPTEDDRTREALARVLGVPLAHDEAVWTRILAYFARSGRAPSPMQRVQAQVPPGAEALENSEGTAPGLLARVGASTVVLLPGPPREMRAMFEREVLPRWVAAGSLDETASRVVWTAGAPESVIALPLAGLMRAPEPVVGTHPEDGEVAVRILARGPGAAARADATVATVRALLGDHVVSTSEDERVQHEVVRLLGARGATVTTAESVTCGLVARMLGEVPGASLVFRGGWVTYSDAWKAEHLGVPAELLRLHGAVSEPVARAMAEGALSRSGATCAVATTGVAGPGPDDRGVPEGTVHVAIAGLGPTRHLVGRHAVSRLAVQRRAAVVALDALRRALMG